MSDEQQRAKFIRLQNGDDILAEVVELEDESGILYTLFNPLKVVYLPSETSGYLSVAFTPWVFPRICDQQEFVLHAEDVLLVVDITDSMNSYYWDNLEHFQNRVKVEEDKINEEPVEEEYQDDYDRLKQVLETLGLDKKKVYH